jgi:PPM family protein phosphatase
MNESGFALVIGHASDQGLVREINEDSYLVLTPPATANGISSLILVADGVGGANAGEIASGALVEYFWNWFTRNDFGDFVHYNPGHPDYFIAALKDLLEVSNERLYQMAHSRAHLADMGTTGTVGIVNGGRLFLGHVGDTRAYLLRQGRLQQLTEDHSWVADEVAAGRLTEAEAQNHPRRNLINRVIGSSPLLRVERKAFAVHVGDIMVFTSDGLTGLVPDEELRYVIMAHSDPQQACYNLISLAKQRGAPDNVTVVVARLQDAGQGSNLAGGVAVNSVALARTTAAAPAPKAAPERSVRSRSAPQPQEPKQLAWRRKLLAMAKVGALSVMMGLLSALFLQALLLFDVYSYLPEVQEWQIAGLLTAVVACAGYWLGANAHRT